MAGRPDGAQNKNKAFLMKRLQDMYGEDFHPIMKMAKNANTLQEKVEGLGDAVENADLIDANKAWAEIAQYVEPKLKAVEHSGKIDARHTVKIIDLSGESKGTEHGNDSVSD